MDIKKLQTLVVDALEDVKAQEIRIYDTSHLTSLFDRVAIASGTSNRQTKALAASVRDKVKAKGGNVVSVEGEDTGEWVLVDLGDMIVHIMQPAIRTYYRLEEIWGDKEVKLGAAKRTGTSAAAKRAAVDEAPAPKTRRTRAQAEAVEASQALDDDEDAPKKPARKPRATTTSTTGTRAAAGTTRTTRTTGTKTTAAKTTTTRGTAAGSKTTTTKAGTTRKAAAPKTPTGKTVRVAPAKSETAKKPAAKRTSKA
ncbi:MULTISPECIES: ribosome silencing factor [Herbaspirillum]|jgi:ribosome-associated protein|uniref:Ribosomal silencing factor RsfS n=2 Tax=Herbaspirillum huttiense TaxID=863372 RepID=A0AAJ2LSX1_9BURK|nr:MULTISPECIES: ribosome silencing factor [Herbaspirillum]MAF02193.1 ribosome silencing factor [Herbaspirillum sp.]MBN9357341.1 ribosome silencing factor [Herbaspirillum huttiense]MBO14453.1 ribosome silencing factor [Herbaspirillum sp.]MBP1316716.1 ribosome-associated protein [Herbaspirillum sp. 1130]MCO4855642.1 ribosome silencing factor [Herbaspirillum sp. WGmk3]